MQENSYYRNLDSIRCFAAFLVVVHHWTRSKSAIPSFGKIGVDIFFVLSGFLITEILLRARKKADNPIVSKQRLIRTFYIRRALRIFPIYYIWITIFIFIFGAYSLGWQWLYFYTYTSNVFVFIRKNWYFQLSYLWTLAVEEQFYLFWPFLILYGAMKHLRAMLAGIIIISLIFLFVSYPQDKFVAVLPFVCMSSLATGALLAYIKNEKDQLFNRLRPFALPMLALMILLFVCFIYSFHFILLHIQIAVFAFFLILFVITSKNYWVNKIFANPVTRYLGKISYGIYLFHLPIPWLVRNLNGTETHYKIGLPKILPYFDVPFLATMENSLLLLGLSSLSWYVIERPIRSWKSMFNY